MALSLGAELGKPQFSNHTSLFWGVIIVADYSSKPLLSVKATSRAVEKLVVMLKSKQIELPLGLFVFL